MGEAGHAACGRHGFLELFPITRPYRDSLASPAGGGSSQFRPWDTSRGTRIAPSTSCKSPGFR